MRHEWNTGALYTEKGQRIVAQTREEPCGIMFVDHDRGIRGFIPMVRVPENTRDLKEATMFNYLRTNYTGAYDYNPAFDWTPLLTLSQ